MGVLRRYFGWDSTVVALLGFFEMGARGTADLRRGAW